MATEFDLVVRGGTLADGTGAPLLEPFEPSGRFKLRDLGQVSDRIVGPRVEQTSRWVGSNQPGHSPLKHRACRPPRRWSAKPLFGRLVRVSGQVGKPAYTI